MRRQQLIGKHGQNLAASVLSGRCGIEMVEQIGTPVKLVPVKTNRPNTYQVIFGEKVSGDHRGIIGNGISVLAETKTILDRNLQYGDLRDHQPERLTEDSKHGGISLLVWVHGSDAYVMLWPVDGFKRGTSISHERAQESSFLVKFATEKWSSRQWKTHNRSHWILSTPTHTNAPKAGAS